MFGNCVIKYGKCAVNARQTREKKQKTRENVNKKREKSAKTDTINTDNTLVLDKLSFKILKFIITLRFFNAIF